MNRSPTLRATMTTGRCAALVLLLAVAGCANRPFAVDPPEAAWPVPNGVDQAPRAAYEYNPDPRPISLCYSSQLNTPQEVIERARALCPNQGRIRFHSEDAVFNGCALFQPYRVTFICTPGQPPPSPYN